MATLSVAHVCVFSCVMEFGAKSPNILVRASLTRLTVSDNSMRDEGVKLLRDAVSGREGFELMDDDNDDSDDSCDSDG